MGKELEFKLAAANDAILDCLLGDPEMARADGGPHRVHADGNDLF